MLSDPNEQVYKKLAVLHSIVLEVISKKNLSVSAEKILNTVLDHLESASGSIHLFSEDKLFLLANRGKGCVNDDLSITSEEEKRFISCDMPVESKDVFLYPSIFKCIEKGQFNFSLLMPMISGDYLVGVVFIGKRINIREYSKTEKLLLAMICKQIATVIHNSYLERELSKANSTRSDLYIKSITDPLTGLYHRAHMEFRLKEDLKVSKRYGRPFSALMIEIDYFFQLSEMNGSQLTYHLLQGISKTIEKAIRTDIDLPSRYSIDTIVVLLPETASKGAMVLAERIRQRIMSLHKVVGIENFPEVTASIGVTALEDKGEHVEDIISKLKEALEQAKSTGRNKVFLCQKYVREKEKVFSTFDASAGMDSELLLANLENENNVNPDDLNKSSQTNAYKTVEFYQKNVSIDWNPQKQTSQIKIKSTAPQTTDDFAYQPLMYLDFIDEEEKEQLKKQQEENKLPEKVVEKASATSNSVALASLKYGMNKKPATPNKYDSLAVKKTQMKHGRIPDPLTSAIKKTKPTDNGDPQIHSLGFIDDI